MHTVSDVILQHDYDHMVASPTWLPVCVTHVPAYIQYVKSCTLLSAPRWGRYLYIWTMECVGSDIEKLLLSGVGQNFMYKEGSYM